MSGTSEAPAFEKPSALVRFRIFPQLSVAEFKVCLCFAVIGGLVAGALGILHDLWTFSISPEYFTKVKFKAFWFADLGLGDRPFAGTIGFLAAGSAGFFVVWFLARRLSNGILHPGAIWKITAWFIFVAFCVGCAELLGFGYGIWRGPNAEYAAWQWAIEKYRVEDVWSFVRVAYIHNSAYLGGGIGLLLSLWRIQPRSPAETKP